MKSFTNVWSAKIFLSTKNKIRFAALAFHKRQIIWKVVHDKPAHSFSTPIFREIAGKMQMIFGGNKEIASYNPDDGSKYWFVNGPSEDFTSSPVYSEKRGCLQGIPVETSLD